MKQLPASVAPICAAFMNTTATDLNTVWRHDAERGPITLRATSLAYATLGIADGVEEQSVELPAPASATEPARRRSGTKQEALIAMLRAEGGASIDEIVTALNWRPQTVRGVMSGALKKRLGLEVTSEKDGDRRVYRIV